MSKSGYFAWTVAGELTAENGCWGECWGEWISQFGNVDEIRYQCIPFSGSFMWYLHVGRTAKMA